MKALSLVLPAMVGVANAANQRSFTKSYAGASSASTVAATTDNKLLAAGENDNNNLQVVAFSPERNEICQAEYGGGGQDIPNDSVVLPNGHVAIAMTSSSLGTGSFDGGVAIVDANNCSLVDQIGLRGEGVEELKGIGLLNMTDGSADLGTIGSSTTYTNPAKRALVFDYLTASPLAHVKSMAVSDPTKADVRGYSFAQLSNGVIRMVGEYDPAGAYADFCVVDMFSNGTNKTQSVFGGVYTDKFYKIVPTADGGSMTFGESNSFSNDVTYEGQVMFHDENARLQLALSVSIPYDYNLVSGLRTLDAGVALAFNSKNFAGQQDIVTVEKWDSQLKKDWTLSFRSTSEYTSKTYVKDMTQSPTGTIVIVGQSQNSDVNRLGAFTIAEIANGTLIDCSAKFDVTKPDYESQVRNITASIIHRSDVELKFEAVYPSISDDFLSAGDKRITGHPVCPVRVLLEDGKIVPDTTVFTTDAQTTTLSTNTHPPGSLTSTSVTDRPQEPTPALGSTTSTSTGPGEASSGLSEAGIIATSVTVTASVVAGVVIVVIVVVHRGRARTDSEESAGAAHKDSGQRENFSEEGTNIQMRPFTNDARATVPQDQQLTVGNGPSVARQMDVPGDYPVARLVDEGYPVAVVAGPGTMPTDVAQVVPADAQ